MLALCRFERHLIGKRVAVFVDNQSALGAFKKGSSSVDDLLDIVTEVWEWAVGRSVTPVFFWVPSALNIADAPSRGVHPGIGIRCMASNEASECANRLVARARARQSGEARVPLTVGSQ